MAALEWVDAVVDAEVVVKVECLLLRVGASEPSALSDSLGGGGVIDDLQNPTDSKEEDSNEREEDDDALVCCLVCGGLWVGDEVLGGIGLESCETVGGSG